MLRRVAGRKLEVCTGGAVVCEGRVASGVERAAVGFGALDDATIAAYVETGEPRDKAGAYGVQGYGAALVERIEGDFFGVMGLPVRLVVELLEAAGRPYRFSR